MGCPAETVIGQNLVFAVACHDPDTGVLTDADSAPTYRVYENETATPILTGTMAKLDGANTTGFYSELIACTAANGFENGKTYTIYIEATVDGDTGGISYGFKAVAASSVTGEGAYTGTLTVDDGDGNALAGAVVNARRSGILKASGTTNADGQIVDWVFDAHSYDLAVRLDSYQPTTETLVVSADGWTKTISLAAMSITAPTAPGLCSVQFRALLSGTAVEGAVCKAKLQGINQAVDGTILSNEEVSDTTDALGVAELELVRKDAIVKGSGIYKIEVTIAGKPVASVETTIPNQSVVLFEDLLT